MKLEAADPRMAGAIRSVRGLGYVLATED
jgi:hypothetical protein